MYTKRHITRMFLATMFEMVKNYKQPEFTIRTEKTIFFPGIFFQYNTPRKINQP